MSKLSVLFSAQEPVIGGVKVGWKHKNAVTVWETFCLGCHGDATSLFPNNQTNGANLLTKTKFGDTWLFVKSDRDISKMTSKSHTSEHMQCSSGVSQRVGTTKSCCWWTCEAWLVFKKAKGKHSNGPLTGTFSPSPPLYVFHPPE